MKKRYSIGILLLILCIGAIFSGCGPDYSSLSLSLKDSERIELSVTDEKVDYYLTINNYFKFNASFSFDFANRIAKIVGDVENKGDGVYKFSIAPIMAGNTTLTINLKGLNKPLNVPVIIRKDVESISALTNVFVKKGQSLTLNNSYFTFTPADTTEKGLTYSLLESEDVNYAENGVTFNTETNTLIVANECALQTIILQATSTFDVNIKTNIIIKVVQEIDGETLDIKIASQDKNSDNPNIFGDYTDLTIEQQEPYALIELIKSDEYSYQKKISIDYRWFNAGYTIEVKASKILTLGGDNVQTITLNRKSDFILSANDVGNGRLTIKIYQTNLPENYKEYYIDVKVTCKPKNITINGQLDIGLQELYTNSSEVKEYKFGVSPEKANKEDYTYKIGFYKSITENISGVFADDFVKLESAPSEYIDVKYGGAEITSEDLGTLESSLTVKAIASTDNYQLAIKIVCYDNDEAICEQIIRIKVYVGTTEFRIKDIYEDGTIYMALSDGKQIFYGIEYSEGSTPGKLTINSTDISKNDICEITQVSTATANLEITPKATGTQEFVIVTANKLSVVLKVVVFREILEDDFIMQIADSANDYVASFEPEDTNSTLKKLTIKGLNSSIKLTDKIKSEYSDYNNYSYSYTLSLNDKGKEYFEINNNSIITSLKFTKELDVNTNKYTEFRVPLSVNLVINTVDKSQSGYTFMLKKVDILKDFEISLSCVNYYKQLTLYASKELNGNQKTRISSIYNKGDLSYINQNLANVYLFIDLVQSEVDQYSLLKITDFEFKSGVEKFKLVGENTVKVGDVGYFYPSSEVVDGYFATGENGYIGSFTYDYDSLRTLDSISITLKIVDPNTNKEFSSDVQLNIEKYVDVESIWLSTPDDTIYLDNTQTYYQKTIKIQVVPANAMCKDLDVKVETNDTNCLGVDIKEDSITFTFQSSGSGRILIFPISKMKTNSYQDEFGEYYYHLTLDFVCADGRTEQTARKISSLKDLKSIEPTKHYYIDSTINCQGEELDLQYLTSGSIRGTFLYETNEDGTYNTDFDNAQQIGSIINFKINNNGDNNFGIFRKISAEAKVYNLSLNGFFNENIELNTSANIGILCGINEGTIKNVTITISQSNSVTISNVGTESTITVNFGLIAGVNTNKIIVDKNSKNYTLLANNTKENLLSINFVSENDSQITSYFGAIAGNNSGEIKQELPETFITIGLYGVTTNVYVNSNANYISGAVGYNTGNVTGLKIYGEIKGFITKDDQAESTSKFVAGVIGYANGGNVSNNISRMFVRGKQTVSGFVGEIGKTNVPTFANNKVQAIDDGTRQGIDATLILAYGDSSSDRAKVVASNIIETTIETYFDRMLPVDLVAKLTGYDYSNGLNIDLANSGITYQIVDSLNKDYYYGEMIVLDKDNQSIIKLDYKKAFTRGEEDKFVTESLITNFILSAYMQAEDENNQTYIQNILDTKSLLEYANIITTDSKIKEFNIEILSPLSARLENFGKNVVILNIGNFSIVISSSLNYKNKVNLSMYITNYYDDVKMYSDKALTREITEIELINKKTTIVYFSLYSNMYNYKNTPIKLKRNTEVTFDIEVQNTNLSAEIQNQTAYVKTIGTDNNTFTSTLVVTTKYILDNNTYFKNPDRFVNYANNYKIYAFVSSNESLDKKSYNVIALTGIEDIKLSKSIIEAEPSDSIEVDVTYLTYNSQDKIIPELRIYENQINNKYKIYTYNEETGLFVNEYDEILFKLTLGEVETLANGRLSQSYILKMPIDSDFNLDVYNYLLNKRIELIFTSVNSSNESATLILQYKAETISSVLINNYSKENNTGMVVTENNVRKVMVDKMLYSGMQTATGEINVLNAYIYTKLSEFEYVDVTMQLGTEGGYLGYLEYSDDEESIGTVSTKAVYTSITNGANIRIYKEDIKADKINNYLVLGIIYRIPKAVADGTIVPITYTFYSQNHTPFVESINLLAKLENQVSFEIVNKDAIEEIDDTKIYNVARGVTYLLNPTIVGFTEDEAVFETSNANIAKVTKERGSYYLTISDANINYGNNQYYEITIRSYGQKTNAGSTINSTIKTTKLHIYEVLVNEDELFVDDEIAIKMLATVDIKNIIANKIQYEYAKLNSKILQEFKQSFLNNTNIYFEDENGVSHKFVSGLLLKTDDYTLECVTENNELICHFKAFKMGDPCDYRFKVEYIVGYSKGVPQIEKITNTSSNIYEKSFTVSSYISTTEDKPAPIFTYEDMLDMKDGEYYKQVEDITIKASELKMLTVSPKMFDGNGHKITITSGMVNFELDSSSDFALFKTLNEDCIIKNISLEITGNLNLTLNNYINTSGANIALLVAENNGIITNCSIKSTNAVVVDIIGVLAIMEKSYLASISAVNTGYITNCQVECNMTASGASLAGVVADNRGSISSTYIKNSRIYNTTSITSDNISTGGFVCTNSGKIFMCYIEGATTTSRIYCDYPNGDYSLTSKIIYTSTKTAGFVYENTGEISDCYSNIPIVSTNESSGFVANAKGGKIVRVFSLSKLKQQDTLNFGFVANIDQNEDVLFEDCFFIIQEGFINYNTSTTNYKYNEINKTYISVIDGIEPLSIADFNITIKDKTTNKYVVSNERFKSFLIDETNALHGVWFFAFNEDKENSSAFDFSTYNCEVDGMEDANGNSISFTARRLQLVAPNLKAYAKEDFVLAEGGSINAGEYTYVQSKDADVKGSKTNPYLISTAKEFEEYCNQIKGARYEYFRLICDIDYTKEDIYASKLYDKSLVGYFDGNGFSISNYSVNSITSNLTAGLFAQIGANALQISCLKNTTFVPAYVNLPNSVYVGGVAGTVANADVYNVSINAKDVIVVGSNIVGGLFGRTAGQTNLAMIYSNISAKATAYNSIALKSFTEIDTLVKNITLNATASNKSEVSYSGAIIGYVDGLSNIEQIEIGENARVLGMISGLMFGCIGGLAKVSDFNLELNSYNNQIISYAFGGYVAGEVVGTVSNFSINSNIINYNLFSTYPITPVAIGGVAGLANEAKINNMTSNQGYAIIGARIVGVDNSGYLMVHNPYIARYIGGIAGYAKNIIFDNINIGNEDDTKIGLALMGGNYVGGIAGYIAGSIDSNTNKLQSDINYVKINLIGQKEYINENEETTTDYLYLSYISSAIGEDIETKPSMLQYLGLLYGATPISNNGYYNLNKAEENIVSVGTDLKFVYAEYGLDLSEGKRKVTLKNLANAFNIYGLKSDTENITKCKNRTYLRAINLKDNQFEDLTLSEVENFK